MAPTDTLAELELIAARLTREAGALAVEALRVRPAVEYKDAKRTDPVTETDRRVEDFLRQALRERFPSHGLLGEERADDDVEAEYLWVVDPVDGTANFANGLPLFAVSVALFQHRVPLVGCIFVTVGPGGASGVLHARRGGGARFEGVPIQVAALSAPAPRLAGLPGGWRGAFTLRGEGARAFGDIRGLGSVCLESALVATGGLRWAIFLGPKLWDVAAAVLLVQEAGGAARIWDRGAWRDLERFEAPVGMRDGKPLTLRHWSRPTLLGSGDSVDLVCGSLVWHRPPPKIVRQLTRFWNRWRAPRPAGNTAGKGSSATGH